MINRPTVAGVPTREEDPVCFGVGKRFIVWLSISKTNNIRNDTTRTMRVRRRTCRYVQF